MPNQVADDACPTPSADKVAWALLGLGLSVLYLPTFWRLFHGIWGTDEQAHGPIMVGIVGWLVFRAWPKLMDSTSGDVPLGRSLPNIMVAQLLGWLLFVFGLVIYAVGRSQAIDFIELGSSLPVVIGMLLAFGGPAPLRVLWFPLFFMIFMVPLPSVVVSTVTMPMKIAVSFVAETVLYGIGLPIARSGVILQIGQYQLLVADACAGLHTLFTLEALGLLYLNIMRHESVMRNVAMAVLIVPISFAANVIRVMVLTVVTYYFGDAAGQGFIHGFAGMVLFLTALLLIILLDTLLRLAVRGRRPGLQ